MAEFVSPADYLRRVGKLGPYPTVSHAAIDTGTLVNAGKPDDIDPAAVRAWAAGAGIEVAARGKLPAVVVEKYRAHLAGG